MHDQGSHMSLWPPPRVQFHDSPMSPREHPTCGEFVCAIRRIFTMWLVLPIYLTRIQLFRTPSHPFYVLSSSILTYRERGQLSSALSYSIFTTRLASSALSSFTLTSVCGCPHSSPASPPSILSVTPAHISHPRPLPERLENPTSIAPRPVRNPPLHPICGINIRPHNLA